MKLTDEQIKRAQLPWDEPTHEEWRSIHQSAICMYGDGQLCRVASDSIRQFLKMRNAALDEVK